MNNRTSIFILSFVLSVCIYAGLYIASPHILLLTANKRVEGITKTFKVDLRNDVYESPYDNVPEQSLDWSTQPGTIRELLDRETESLPPLPLDERFEPAAVPELAERATESEPQRDYDLERNDDVFKGIDAQILEISESTARKDIEIARRLVEPVSTRILEKNELPVLGGMESGVPYRASASGSPDAANESDIDSQSEVTDVASVQKPKAFSLMEAMDEEMWDSGETSEPDITADITFPDIPDELVVARELVRQEIEETSTFESMDELVGLDVSTYVDPKTGQGFFQVRIGPSSGTKINILSKDITFVLDASNSISQHKLDLTVRGLVDSLDFLRPDDKFNIVVFRDSPVMFRDDFQNSTSENIDAAKTFLRNLESKGATDLYSAIRPVISKSPRPGSPGIVIVISDGRPTGGNLAGRDLINSLSDENVHGNSIYTFGGGKTVNTYLLDLLAYRNKGISYTTNRMDQIDDQLPRFIGQLQDAFLVNLRGDFGRINEETIFPKRIPDFFQGREVTLYGKFNPEKDKQMIVRLRGDAGAEHKDMILKADFTPGITGDREIARRWAFEKVYYLIGEISRLGETPELMDMLNKLSRDYDIASIYQP